jgi:hypothetical protein
MRIRKIALVVASILLILCIGVIASVIWFEFRIRRPYYDFLAQEQEVVPLLDTLNAEVESQLPPLPLETELKLRKSMGLEGDSIYREHGRFLRLDFSTSLTTEEISSYYQSTLSEREWLRHPIWQVSGSEYYYRGTSCIRIAPPPTRKSLIAPSEYSITIWHDFANQPFTPEIPSQLDSFLHTIGIGIEMENCP